MSCLSDKAVKFVERLKKDDRREYGPYLKHCQNVLGSVTHPAHYASKSQLRYRGLMSR